MALARDELGALDIALGGTHSVLVAHGPGHVVVYQDDAWTTLGTMVGVPISESLCDGFVGFLKMLDDVLATGISYHLPLRRGELWMLRLEDESGVGLHLGIDHGTAA